MLNRITPAPLVNAGGVPNEDFRDILTFIANRRGLDFSAYRESTIRRRLAHRIRMSGAADHVSYRRRLEEDPREIDALIDAFTINVSHFFRDPLVFEVLREIVLPNLAETFGPGTLRIWCAGCAGGEEAYSAAILSGDVMNAETAPFRPFIVATDIDRGALDRAASGVYRSEALPEVRKKHLDACFTRCDETWTVRPEIRSLVTFAYHDVASLKPPAEGIFSDYHLVLCRNVLLYFERSATEKIQDRLAEFVSHGGYLVLGEAETLLSQRASASYEQIQPKTRTFRKK